MRRRHKLQKGGATELQEAFALLEVPLKYHLAGQDIAFQFNPPNFRKTWEWEIWSVGNLQTVTEPVLHTVVVEVEGNINFNPIEYILSEVTDLNPVTQGYC